MSSSTTDTPRSTRRECTLKGRQNKWRHSIRSNGNCVCLTALVSLASISTKSRRRNNRYQVILPICCVYATADTGIQGVFGQAWRPHTRKPVEHVLDLSLVPQNFKCDKIRVLYMRPIAVSLSRTPYVKSITYIKKGNC